MEKKSITHFASTAISMGKKPVGPLRNRAINNLLKNSNNNIEENSLEDLSVDECNKFAHDMIMETKEYIPVLADVLCGEIMDEFPKWVGINLMKVAGWVETHSPNYSSGRWKKNQEVGYCG